MKKTLEEKIKEILYYSPNDPIYGKENKRQLKRLIEACSEWADEIIGEDESLYTKDPVFAQEFNQEIVAKNVLRHKQRQRKAQSL